MPTLHYNVQKKQKIYKSFKIMKQLLNTSEKSYEKYKLIGSFMGT